MANQHYNCQGCLLDQILERVYFALIFLGIITVPLLFTLTTQELFEFPKILAVYFLAIITTSIWLGRMIITKRLIVSRSFIDLAVIIFLITQLLATLFSSHPYTSIYGYYTRFNGGLASVFAYSLIYLGLSGSLINLKSNQPNVAKKIIFYLIISLITSGLISALYAIPEKFGYSFSCVFAVNKLTTDCWQENTNPKYRIFGTFGQPNWLAAYLITIWPMVILPITNCLANKKTKQKINSDSKHQQNNKFICISVVLSLIFFWALWLTDSRSGILGFLASLLLITFLLILSRQVLTKKAKYILAVLTGVSLLICSHLGWQWWQNSQDLQPSQGGSDSGAIRKVVWRGAYLVWKNHFWLGTGPETFAYSYYLYRPVEHNLLSEWDFLYNKAHNEWLNLLANTGTIGFLGFVLVQLTIANTGIKLIFSNHAESNDKTLAIAILSGLLALQISNFFGFSTVAVSLVQYVLMAILVFLRARPNDTDVENQAKNKIGFGRSILLLTLVICFCTTSQLVFNIYRADINFTQGLELLQTNKLESGLKKLETAIKLRPQEALFYDNLAEQYSIYAQSLINQSDGQKIDGTIKELAKAAIATSNIALSLNPRHLNFYKTQVRILSRLSSVDSTALEQALIRLDQAQALAPTDPKLVYNHGRILLFLGKTEQAITQFRHALAIKPDYPEPRFDLAQALIEQGELVQAKDQYEYIITHLNPNDATSLAQIKAIDASLSAQFK